MTERTAADVARGTPRSFVASLLALIGVTAIGAGPAIPAQGNTFVDWAPFAAQDADVTAGHRAQSGLQIQNLSGEVGQLTATPFGQLAGRQDVITFPDLPARTAANLYLPSGGLASGLYGFEFASNRPLAHIQRTDWFEHQGAIMTSSKLADRQLAVPVLVRRYHGASSVVAIMGRATQAFNVSATARSNDTGAVRLSLVRVITPDSGPVVLDLESAEFDSLGDEFLGSLWIEADAPVVADSFVDIGGERDAVYGFEAQPATGAADQLLVPLFRARQETGSGPASQVADTGIAVFNPGEAPVTASIEYFGAGGSCTAQHFVGPSVPLPPRTSHVFYLGDPATQGVPANCYGSARVTGTGPLLGVVNDAVDYGAATAAYVAGSAASAARSVALPLWRKGAQGCPGSKLRYFRHERLSKCSRYPAPFVAPVVRRHDRGGAVFHVHLTCWAQRDRRVLAACLGNCAQ